MTLHVNSSDTIVAISTPVGRGGIGVVRVSGPRALDVAQPVLRLRHELAAGRARFGAVVDTASGDVLDECVATYFAAPHSYTGEDVVEIAAHGAPVLLEYLVRACCAAGARLAEAGEFTQRAFLAGRIDLTQAEAVDDLIGSSTLEQARLAARQLGGALAKIVAPVKEQLVGLIAALEAGIDFAEDDIDVLPAEVIAAEIAEVRGPLEQLERSFAYGRVVRDGFRLAIVGRPNAGKSSLFNRLVERDRAIVTAKPGTTRDLVTETVAIGGIPVELVDTAGLREGADEAERMGIAKSHEAMADADVLLLVIDAAAGWSEEDAAVLQRIGAAGNVLEVWNKCDLVADRAAEIPFRMMEPSRKGHSNLHANVGAVRTSAVTGAGIAELRVAIVRAVGGDGGALREAAMLTNLRQHQAVSAAVAGLDAARAAVGAAIPHEMVMLDLYGALRGLDALTGATTSEDVLRLIFSKFCIGK
ncbi:MAG TPA: tRNA uridine-5-carboxymethylaminomethyl(34) synthesis GTPase MnmE [Acidobacteriaceae bacterium]|nr:tRNA uridine-5-carboxymethylaminomethyl(34) synthesis GTPase MnmE [Acidobacteriaceae bacterium]